MAIKRCTSPFAYWVDGAPRTYTAGQLIEDDDPGYKGHEAHFEDVETHVADKADRASRVEQATAEPGERRTVTRPVRRPVGRGKGKDEKAGEGQ